MICMWNILWNNSVKDGWLVCGLTISTLEVVFIENFSRTGYLTRLLLLTVDWVFRSILRPICIFLPSFFQKTISIRMFLAMFIVQYPLDPNIFSQFRDLSKAQLSWKLAISIETSITHFLSSVDKSERFFFSGAFGVSYWLVCFQWLERLFYTTQNFNYNL